MPGHHQEIKCGFLGIAQEKVFADMDAENLFHLFTALNGSSGIVVDPGIGDG